MLNVIEENPGANEIYISPENSQSLSGNIVVNGRGNAVHIGRLLHCDGLYARLTGGCELHIGENCVINRQSLQILVPQTISILDGSAFNGQSVIHIYEGGSVHIGRDCLFADGISINTSHFHRIYDEASGERLNPAGNIVIGNHVWVAVGATLWAGADIGDGSVVGANTYVSKKFPGNCIVAGTPARVVRDGIRWEA